MELQQWIDLAGGIGLFLYGMQLMTDGLAQAAAGPLHTLMERATHTLPRAILTGALVTAVVQSSSAVSLLVIGLTGSGILPLPGAAGVILGANIGTTTTGMLVAWGSAGGGPAVWASLFCLMGAVLTLFCPRKAPAKVGQILLGFGLLFSGLDGVRAAAAPLAHSEQFCKLLHHSLGTVSGVLGGVCSSLLLQSSSAAVGLLQAVAGTGLLTLHTAIPLILGQNLGACLTPLAAARAVGGSAGMCCARFHLLFNTLGTALALLLRQLVSTRFGVFGQLSATPYSIALLHTLFNLGAVLLLAPFTRPLLGLCCPKLPGKSHSGPANFSAKPL